MKKINHYILLLLIGVVFSISGCEDDNYELGKLVSPTNLDLSYEIIGLDTENPYGDGSGVVDFVATADNEITYTYDFGDGTNVGIAADGTISHMFTKTGINLYNVTVSAVGTGGLKAVKTIQIEVYSSFTDDEAVQFLTGGTSKNWYWAADKSGHIALGPNFTDGGDVTYGSWWSAAAWEKTCMYDAEFVFTYTADGGITFEQTAGPSYVPGTYAGNLGVTADACYGSDVVDPYGVKNVSLIPSASIATVAGEYRGTSMSFSDGGYMCWYVGSSEYEIISITENTLTVRQEESETYAWYMIFTTEKPVE